MRQHPLADGVLYSTWRDIVKQWGDRWRNFEPWEFASHDNGEFYWHERTFDAIQQARDIVGRPLVINSGHRSWMRNLAIGGAPRSAHLFIALDVSLRGHNLQALYMALKAAGFKSFGFYRSFIHVDLRPGRKWYGSQEAKAMWKPILDGEFTDVRL